MLRIVYVDSPQAKERFFLENKSQEDLWLVSNIEAKRSLQNVFLKEQNTINNKSVLRASEYWQWLFSTNRPDWRSVSESLIFALLEQWFSETKIQIQYANLEMFRQFFGQALPLITGSNKLLLEDWLETDPQRAARLRGWFDNAQEFWKYISHKKWIGRSWVVSLLCDTSGIFYGNYEDFFVDLGLDLRQEEVEFLLQMSQQKSVTVVIPQTSWSDKYESSMRVYKKLIESAQETMTVLGESQRVLPHLVEHPSVLKEVKDVVKGVRSLLDASVPPQDIAVLSANIEDYWDMLREHFLVEGIPLQKKYVARAIALPSIQSWLSRLNIAKADFEQAHLETYFFANLEESPGTESYQKFKKDFSYIYDPEDVREYLKLPEAHTTDGQLALTDFVEFAMSLWKGEEREVVDDIVDLMTQEIRPGDTFSYNLWLKYLELIISRYEIDVRAADRSGILVTNFSQADWSTVQNAFILGCEQNQLREITPTPLSGEDIARIELDLGFYLQRQESLKKEFELRWFCEKPLQHLHLSHSHSDFDGNPQIASSFWMELDHQLGHQAALQAETRWDALMKCRVEDIQSELDISKDESLVLQAKLKREHSLDFYEPVPISSNISLSAGSLKKYFECPFQFYVEKVLKLRDMGEFDLDVDPMFQGQLWHKMVEDIHNEHPDLNLSQSDLERLYAKAAKDLDVNSPLKKFWLNEKNRHLAIIHNFLNFERQWRAQFTTVKTIATEADLKGYIGIKDDQVVLSPEPLNETFHIFNGRVDRIDQNSKGHLAVVDYKTSQSGLKAFKSWPKNGLFQMPLYALALEAGLAPQVAPADVTAASYLIFKEQKRGLGFFLKDHEVIEFNEPKDSQGQSTEAYKAVIDEVLSEIKNIFNYLRSGFFKPQPRDKKICERCQWSRVCRAPHLK